MFIGRFTSVLYFKCSYTLNNSNYRLFYIRPFGAKDAPRPLIGQNLSSPLTFTAELYSFSDSHVYYVTLAPKGLTREVGWKKACRVRVAYKGVFQPLR